METAKVSNEVDENHSEKHAEKTKKTKHAGQSANAGTRLVEAFNQLTAENIDSTIDELYSETLHFRDPVTELHDREAFKKYLGSQYKHVISCKFEQKSNIHSGNQTTVEWIMTLRHKFLNLGNPIELRGVSIVTEDHGTKTISHHHDYFDLSAFVLKSIPGVQMIYNKIKSLH